MSGKSKKVSIIKVDTKTDEIDIKSPGFFEQLFNKMKTQDTPKKNEPELKVAKKIDESRVQRREFTRVKDDTLYECIRCGWCCRQDWRVNVTWIEFDRLKKHLNIDQVVVDERSGMSHPLFEIKDACVCLNTKKNLCKIHSKRPYSCATFPFGFDTKGRLMYHKNCQGIGKGPKVDLNNMTKKIMKHRKKAGMEG
jgi:Fe-S-cluster containining protein